MEMAQYCPRSLNTSYLLKDYDDRFHRILYPMQENTIPKKHDYLKTNDIKGASPGSMSAKTKQFQGRDYMNIKDIPGVKPNPSFILYKSKHKDYKLDVSDIVDNSAGSRRKHLFDKPHNNPLEPRYVRLSESRRHVQVYGDIDGCHPKQTIAPKTRRQTNMVDDITGSKPNPVRHVPSREFQPNQLRQASSQSHHVNPITGQEYVINTDFSKPISLMKEDNSNKSRRLARILENFKNTEDDNYRSRSSIKIDYKSNAPQYLSNRYNDHTPHDQHPPSRRNYATDVERARNDDGAKYTSKDIKPAELPSFSQRKLGHEKPSFRAYEDMAVDIKPKPSRRFRMDLKIQPKGNNSFGNHNLSEKQRYVNEPK